jgi:hypothetical protein
MINIIDKTDWHIESHVLEKLGDYLVYDAGEVDHTAEALEDSLLIVFRWPSKR